jgi:truncated hemoglobin YjbI
MALLGLMTLTSYAASPGTVYESLGGKKAIGAVVDDFVARVAGDNRINGFFKDTASDPARLAKIQAEPGGSDLRGDGRPL